MMVVNLYCTGSFAAGTGQTTVLFGQPQCLLDLELMAA